MNIPGFTQQRIEGTDGVHLNVAVGGEGPALVLLHGFPQTHLCWRDVAVELAVDHTVICPDLRGYGDSDKPADTGETYSKRTMANDVVAVTKRLGFERFALAGHDRGALVAIRAGLDHPDTVTHLASLDVFTTLDTWDVMAGRAASVGWHLYLMAQPPGLPEAMINAVPEAFFGHFLDIWAKTPLALRDLYVEKSRAAVTSIVADYRASAGIDVDHDEADRDAGRRLRMPVTVLQQDWGPAMTGHAVQRWQSWAPDLEHRTVTSGHFMAEEDPATISQALRDLLKR
ncbi:alpha/beta fold hydrolase [Kineosporia succinea]|uniref:Pimeloyl-ACP methyl ester carboxylesterase n=1 Tax=Kineosporia succinea TaxID=84632 RepID=A0ABT9P2J7_9ACTN|nr:alpha/beta hydrolase [Kineosporia succinea]MDP9826325.1 pimeloyl-ACP methyl ester carboxylesterase [Kineosporia succinea]